MLADDDPSRDWTEPGVYRCAPDVYRIPLPLPSDGLRAVNVYAVADGDGWTLIDGGWAIAAAREQLVAAFAALGSTLSDIRRFLVTHVHRDHYTQAVALRREFGATVALGRGEQPSLERLNNPNQDADSPRIELLLRGGAKPLVERIRAEWAFRPNPADWEFPDEWIDDGDEIVVGDRRKLTAIATPGHTQGHVVFADPAADLLFAGDHVLPRITPSIGLESVASRRPLADFLASLRLLKTRPDALLLPAHGPVEMRVHERVDQLLAHHADRLERTLSAVREGRSTAYEVAGALTWTRRNRRLDELDLFNAAMAVTETMAHLDVLADRGAVTVTEQEGVLHYRV